MNRKLLVLIAAVAVVALVGFAVMRSSAPAAPRAVRITPGSAGDSSALPPRMMEAARIEQAELKQLFDQKNVTLIDVRDADAYLASHITGALQIPLSRVEGEMPFLPKGKPIVFYCTCPNDEAAIEAVQILEHAGMHGARALHGGLQEWTRLGFPTASGAQ
jgi:rhodanese-related sulfurtransferase